MSTVYSSGTVLTTFSGRRFGFAQQLERGAQGVDTIVTYLSEQGHEVVNLAEEWEWQHRGVDLMVDGRAVEVKSDFHKSQKVFFEVTCGGKPGCIFTSRADDLYYFFPKEQVLYILPMADAQWWLATHLGEYRLTTITSTRGNRTWTASGIAVPVTALQTLDTMRIVRWNSSSSTPRPFSMTAPSASNSSKPNSSASARRRKTSGLRLLASVQK